VAALMFFWPTVLLVATAAASAWTRRLLAWAGHDDPEVGRYRAMGFASAVTLPMGINVCLMMAALPLAAASPWAGLALLAAAAVGYVALWVHWSYVLMRAFEAETRGLQTMLGFWAFCNPGLAVGLLPLLAGAALALPALLP
jgi:hypothetical protein